VDNSSKTSEMLIEKIEYEDRSVQLRSAPNDPLLNNNSGNGAEKHGTVIER